MLNYFEGKTWDCIYRSHPAMVNVVSTGQGPGSILVIGELYSDTMALSSQLLKMLQEPVLSAEKSQMAAPRPASSLWASLVECVGKLELDRVWTLQILEHSRSKVYGQAPRRHPALGNKNELILSTHHAGSPEHSRSEATAHLGCFAAESSRGLKCVISAHLSTLGSQQLLQQAWLLGQGNRGKGFQLSSLIPISHLWPSLHFLARHLPNTSMCSICWGQKVGY